MNRCLSLKCGVEYVPIQKCGCTIIKEALLRSDGIKITTGIQAHVHRHWSEIPADYIPRQVFTFVRHPYNRFYSNYNEKLKTGKAKILGCPLPTDATVDDFAKWITSQNPARLDGHWKPQYNHLISYKRFPPITWMGRLEHFSLGWEYLMHLYGLPPLNHDFRNVSPTRSEDKLSSEMLNQLVEFYRQDYEMLGYDIPYPF